MSVVYGDAGSGPAERGDAVSEEERCPWCGQVTDGQDHIIGALPVYRPCGCSGANQLKRRYPWDTNVSPVVLETLAPGPRKAWEEVISEVVERALRTEWPDDQWDQSAAELWPEATEQVRQIRDARRKQIRVTFTAQALRWAAHFEIAH